MSTPQYGKGSFDYEGDDMIYDVRWEVHDSEMECFVNLTTNGKLVEVTDVLFDNVLDRIYGLAWDEHWGASA